MSETFHRFFHDRFSHHNFHMRIKVSDLASTSLTSLAYVASIVFA